MIERVFDLERVLDEFSGKHSSIRRDELIFRDHLTRRSLLGCAARGDTPDLQRHRKYYKVSFPDFFDFATSELSSNRHKVGDFEENCAAFVEGLDTNDPLNDFAFDYAGRPARASLMDLVVARDQLFVSVTARWLVHKDAPAVPMEHLVTLLCAPSASEVVDLNSRLLTPGDVSSDLGAGWLDMPLSEWERGALVYYPGAGLKETGFAVGLSGVLSDERNQRIVQGMNEEERERWARTMNPTSAIEGLFELTRLGFQIPAYVRFMYDLVVSERRTVGSQVVRRIEKRRGRRVKVNAEEVVYKTIRSIRVVAPPSEGEGVQPSRNWTPPSHSYAVRGHWRVFSDPSRQGHGPDGVQELGRTWVRDYVKGESAPPLPFPTTAAERTPRVIVGVKQPLAYARDVVLAAKGQLSPSADARGVGESKPTQRDEAPAIARADVPSDEWMAAERSKLSAGLRYLIMRRDSFTCCLCGRRQAEENFVRLEVDHRTPISNWGRTVPENLWTLCRECNRGKGARSIDGSPLRA
jgi:hypothetical protein